MTCLKLWLMVCAMDTDEMYVLLVTIIEEYNFTGIYRVPMERLV